MLERKRVRARKRQQRRPPNGTVRTFPSLFLSRAAEIRHPIEQEKGGWNSRHASWVRARPMAKMATPMHRLIARRQA